MTSWLCDRSFVTVDTADTAEEELSIDTGVSCSFCRVFILVEIIVGGLVPFYCAHFFLLFSDCSF